MEELHDFVGRISMSVLGQEFRLRIETDPESPEDGRLFLQVVYEAPDTKSGQIKEWRGRKWRLSKHMIKDEIVKTAFAAFKAAVEHEVMEGFKFDGTIVFNPHVSFEALLSVSEREVFRL